MERNGGHSGDCAQTKGMPLFPLPPNPDRKAGNIAGAIRGTKCSSQHGPFLVGTDGVQPWTLQFRKLTLTCYSRCRNITRGKQMDEMGWALSQHTVRTAEQPELELCRSTHMWICHCWDFWQLKTITDKSCSLETLKILRKKYGSWRDWAVVKSTCHLIMKMRVQTLISKSGCSQTLVTEAKRDLMPSSGLNRYLQSHTQQKQEGTQT